MATIEVTFLSGPNEDEPIDKNFSSLRKALSSINRFIYRDPEENFALIAPTEIIFDRPGKYGKVYTGWYRVTSHISNNGLVVTPVTHPGEAFGSTSSEDYTRFINTREAILLKYMEQIIRTAGSLGIPIHANRSLEE